MNVYRVEKDAERHPFLVEEKSVDYGSAYIKCPQDAVDLFNYAFRLGFLAEEHVYQLCLDTKGNILGMFEVSHGTINTAHCSPREIYLRALVSGANSIIVVHNHPSGDVSPSDVDIITCKRLYEAGQLLGITVDDFIIIGDEDYYSFNKEGVFRQYG